MQFYKCRGENIEDRRARFGVLSAENAQQRVALRYRCPLIDNDGGFAVALVVASAAPVMAEGFPNVYMTR